MAKKKLSSKSNYVPNRMINEIEVERNGKTTYIDGANVLDGMYVKKGVKYGNGGGTAVSSENGGYTVGTNADFSINHPSSDVDYSMYAKGGDVNAIKIGDKVKYNGYEYYVEGMLDDKTYILSNFKKFGHNKEYRTIDEIEKYAKGGGVESKAKYVPNYMVQSVEVERKGKTTDIDGADIYDGFYVKKGVKFAKGGNLKTKNGVSYKVIEFNSPMGKYKYVINGLKIGGYNFSYVSDKKLSDAEIERVASENKFANGGSVWGGTAESSQDGMLIGGTNSELTSNQYGEGGSIDTWEYSIGGL